MKKFFSLLILSLFSVAVLKAQITERENDNTIYKLGNRPEKGTKVLGVGFNLNDTTFSNFKVGNQGIFIMGRYFISDRTAIRGSIRCNKDSRVTRGLDVDTSVSFTNAQLVHDLRTSKREYAIMPGIERHFKYTNLFDIYVGADAILGFTRSVKVENNEYTSNVYSRETKKTPETLAGLNGLVGLNLFIGDLPISLGFEYNFSALARFGGKTHVIRETRDAGGNVNNDDYFTQDTDAFDNPDNLAYNKLKRRSLESNDSFRIMLNFYIK